MDIIDTHAHLEQECFSDQLSEILERGRKAGVDRVLCVGTSLPTSRRCIELSRQHPETLAAAVGIQPTRCAEADSSWSEQMGELLQNDCVVAVGETGLDFHHEYSTQAEQEAFFRRHVRLSLDINLPLIVHARKADPETLAILNDETSELRGVRHCFDSSTQIAEQYVEMGMHVAFGGILTRPGHKKLKQAARRVPDGKLLVETDCPYMIPDRVEAERNEPAYITHTIHALASLRDQCPDEIAEITTTNARMLFFHEE
jgi:TatD DNase family protein